MVDADGVQHRPVAPRGRLQHAVPVHQEDVVVRSEPGSHDLLGKHLSVDGSAQDVVLAALALVLGGDGEVGRVTIAKEGVADEDAAPAHTVEPVLIVVVPPLEVVGARVAELLPAGIDETQVGERAQREGVVHLLHEARECLFVAQFRERTVLDDEAQRRASLREEELQRSLIVGHLA